MQPSLGVLLLSGSAQVEWYSFVEKRDLHSLESEVTYELFHQWRMSEVTCDFSRLTLKRAAISSVCFEHSAGHPRRNTSSHMETWIRFRPRGSFLPSHSSEGPNF